MLYTDKQGCIYLKICPLGLNNIKWGTEYERKIFKKMEERGKREYFS
jgi:hypothetical protein